MGAGRWIAERAAGAMIRGCDCDLSFGPDRSDAEQFEEQRKRITSMLNDIEEQDQIELARHQCLNLIYQENFISMALTRNLKRMGRGFHSKCFPAPVRCNCQVGCITTTYIQNVTPAASVFIFC